jgi:hypothetical protein
MTQYEFIREIEFGYTILTKEQYDEAEGPEGGK